MDKSEAYYNKMKYTPVLKLVIMLGIPTTISMLITNIYNAVDTYFVGTLGDSPQAATGILFTLQCIIQAFAFMLGHGSGTYVAKRLADKDIHGASVYVSTAFFNGLIVGTILLIFGTVFINPFMVLLGSSDTVLPYAREYGLWVLISAPFMIASLVLNNNLRYEGKAFYSMIGLVTGAILNIFGDYIFINVMNLGVFGAGMSTGISQIVSFVILLFLYIKNAQGKISIKLFSMDIMVHFNIFRGGLPSLIRQGLTSISNGVLNNLVKPFGDSAVAAISIVNRYSNLIMCTGLGIGQGLQPVAAFNYGVKDYRRVKNGMYVTLIYRLL
jgi:putative MATE family efflux protein